MMVSSLPIRQSGNQGTGPTGAPMVPCGVLPRPLQTYDAADTFLEGGGGKRRSWVQRLEWEPRAYVFHGFLSDEECGHLVDLVSPPACFGDPCIFGDPCMTLRMAGSVCAPLPLPLGVAHPPQPPLSCPAACLPRRPCRPLSPGPPSHEGQPGGGQRHGKDAQGQVRERGAPARWRAWRRALPGPACRRNSGQRPQAASQESPPALPAACAPAAATSSNERWTPRWQPSSAASPTGRSCPLNLASRCMCVAAGRHCGCAHTPGPCRLPLPVEQHRQPAFPANTVLEPPLRVHPTAHAPPLAPISPHPPSVPRRSCIMQRRRSISRTLTTFTTRLMCRMGGNAPPLCSCT